MNGEIAPLLTDASASRTAAWPRALIAIALVGLAVSLRATGQPWWCSCGTYWPWGYPTQSMHNSQHLVDAYSFSHLLHGVIFFFVLRLAFRKLRYSWPLFLATAIEVGWELLENSPIVINRYRNGTAALGYSGDSIFNSLGDVGSMIVGFLIARKIGLRWSIALYLVIELAMLWWIRDNLTLNVLMLLYPIEAIKQWQMA